MRCFACVGVSFAVVLTLAGTPAHAYRPFDSTDADVAGKNEFELELGPIGSLRDTGNRYWVAPAVVANFGLAGDRELVLQGQRQQSRDRGPDVPATSVVNTGIFIKQLLRR